MRKAEEFQKEVIDALAQFQVDNATKFTRDRSKSVGASEVFRCLRQIRMDKDEIIAQGQKPPHKNLKGGYMQRGKTMEDAFVAPALKKHFGARAKWMGDDQETFKSPECEHLTATPDGNLDGACLVEIKTFDPRAKLTEPKDEHVLQTHVQMGVTGIKTHTYLIYVQCSDWFDVRIWKIPYSDVIYKRAVARAEKVMNCTNFLDLPAEGMLKGDCGWCQRKDQCGIGKATPAKKKDIASATDLSLAVPACDIAVPTHELAAKATRLYELEATIKRLKKEYSELDLDVKSDMVTGKESEFKLPNGKIVELTHPKPRRSFNKKQLATDYDISDEELEAYMVTSTKVPKPKLVFTDESKSNKTKT